MRILTQMFWKRRRRRIRAPAGAFLGHERLDAERVTAGFAFVLRAQRRVLRSALLAIGVARRGFKLIRSLRRRHVGLLGRRVAMLQHVEYVLRSLFQSSLFLSLLFFFILTACFSRDSLAFYKHSSVPPIPPLSSPNQCVGMTT